MSLVRRSRELAVAAVLVLLACGSDSTRPRLDTQAAHYDSLALVAGRNGDVARDAALSIVALAYQAGIEPGTVTVQDSGAATVYRAVVVRNVFSNPSPLSGATEMRDLVLWQEPDGARFIHVFGQTDSTDFAPSDDSPVQYGEIDWGSDDRREGGADGYVLLVAGAPSGSCALVSATSMCTPVSFTVSIDAVVKPVIPGTRLVNFDAAPHPIVAASQVVPGLSMTPR